MVFEGREADHGGRAGLGTRVRNAIRDAGINHSEVARSIGLEPSKLSKSLAGTRKFRVEEITRIAQLTDVTTDWLTLGREEGAPRRQTAPLAPTHSLTEAAGEGASAPPAAGDDLPRPDASTTWMSKGTRNRRRIVAAAWELYADRGIDAVRVHDIAAAAGLSASAINYHFRTKTALLEAALHYSLEIIATARDLVEPEDPAEVLLRFSRVHAGVDPTVRRVWSIWIQSWARAVVDERSRLNLAAVYAKWMDLIRGVVVAGQRVGQVRDGDTDLMVKSLSVFIDGLGVARSTAQMSLTDDDALAMIDTFLRAHILVPGAEPAPMRAATRPPDPAARPRSAEHLQDEPLQEEGP